MKTILQKINQSSLAFDLFMASIGFILAFCLADYLGQTATGFGAGLGWISSLLLLLGMKLMEFYFLTDQQLDADHHFLQKWIPGLNKTPAGRKTQESYQGMLAILLCFGSWAVIQFVLLQMGFLQSTDLILLGAILAMVYLLNGSRLHLANSAFGELGQAFLLFGLLPLYAYALIRGEFHLLILLCCMPLTFYYLACRILVSLSRYSQDMQSGRINFMQRVGWKRGMLAHNLFILLGFATYAAIPIFNYPVQIFLSPLVTLPLGILLILILFRIEKGKKPEWQISIFLEKMLLVLVVYFLTASMILR